MYLIYKLYYTQTTEVYVGITSRSLESRLQEHSTRLQRGVHHSYKLQTAHSLHGLPEVVQIATADTKALAEELEIFYIAEYDSFRCGYNCTRGGEAMGVGEDCHSALYTQDDYLCVLAFLAHTSLSRQEIAQECGVGSSVVAHIAQRKNHLYLEALAPEDYQLIRSRNRQAEYFATLDNKYPPIYSPSGEVFIITNARAFARKHGLDHACLGKVIRGERSSHKGWTLYTQEQHNEPTPTS